MSIIVNTNFDKNIDKTVKKWFENAFKENPPTKEQKNMVVNLIKLREEELEKRDRKRIMFKTMVQRNVDTIVVTLLSQYKSLVNVQAELSNRIIGMKNAVTKINPDRVVDINMFSEQDWMDKIDNFREEYFLYYIYFLNKRIKDLQWILDNRFRDPQIKFAHLYNHQIFKLIKLKERLDPKEEALV